MICIRSASLLALIILPGIASCGPGEPEEPLIKAARLGRTNQVESLLASGVDINMQPGPRRLTALHAACGAGRADIVRLLLAKGADPELRDAAGATSWDLIWNRDRSLNRREQEVMVALLEGGVKLESENDERGRTWLHRLCEKVSSSRMVSLLVRERGFDANARDAHGWTPLHVAVFANRYDTTLALLQQGADVNAETTKEIKKTFLKGETHVTRYCYQAGSRPLDLYHGTFTRGSRNLTRLLEEHGAKRNPAVKNTFVR